MIGFCGGGVSPLFQAGDGRAQSSGRALWHVPPKAPHVPLTCGSVRHVDRMFPLSGILGIM